MDDILNDTHASTCATQQLTTFLLGHSNLDEICQFCVLDLIAPLHPWQMSVYTVGSDSLFRLRGSFGRGPGQGSLHDFSCLDDSHVGGHLRQGLPLANFAILGMNADQAKAVHDLDNGPQVLWPLTTTHRLDGVIQVRFSSVPDPQALHETMMAIAAPVTLALLLSTSRNRRSGDVTHSDSTVGLNDSEPGDRPASRNGHDNHRDDSLTLVPSPRKPALDEAQHTSSASRSVTALKNGGHQSRLTPRQQHVLELMSKSMTNAQIARVLAFSESTVRQETMAIYRVLQVPGRSEAVIAGRASGLLPELTQASHS